LDEIRDTEENMFLSRARGTVMELFSAGDEEVRQFWKF